MLYSELRAKPVLSLDGAYLGKVTGAFFSKDTNDCHAIAAERGIFSPADMYAVKDVVTLKQGTEDLPIPSAETHMFLTTDMLVFDCKGEELGKVVDFYVEAHNKKEDVIMTSVEEYPFRKLLFTADSYVMINKGDQLPRKKRTKNLRDTMGILPSTITAYSANAADELLAPAISHTIDYQNYGEYRFLIGRTLSKTLTDLNHTVIVSAGTIITNDIVEDAKRKGKLSELTKYSK